MAAKRALITGGTGFVGRHLAKLLEEKGTEVVSLSSNPAENDSCVRNFRFADIRNESELSSLFSDVAPDRVFHLAAISSISDATENEHEAFETNVWGTRNVLRAASRLKNPPRVLNVSTSQVYGESAACPIPETSPIDPRNSYAATKAMAEVSCRQFAERLEIVNVRPFNHSGPGQSPHFVLSSFAKQIAAIEFGAEPVIRTGDLSVRRDFADVRDVVTAYELLLEKGRAGETYNVCSGQAYRVSDALDYLLSLTGKMIEVRRDPAKERSGQAAEVFGDATKLRSETGWQSEITFKQMLKDILDYWRKSLAAKQAKPACGSR